MERIKDGKTIQPEEEQTLITFEEFYTKHRRHPKCESCAYFVRKRSSSEGMCMVTAFSLSKREKKRDDFCGEWVGFDQTPGKVISPPEFRGEEEPAD